MLFFYSLFTSLNNPKTITINQILYVSFEVHLLTASNKFKNYRLLLISWIQHCRLTDSAQLELTVNYFKIMSNNRSDFVGPILLAILAYLASMLTRAFQRSIEHSAVIRSMNREENLNHTVVDDFIKDEVVLKQLQDPKVWEACDKDNLRWWDGKSKPKNIWEQLAKQIWEDRDEFQTAAGFEYWCNIIQDQKNLPWHIDKGKVAGCSVSRLAHSSKNDGFSHLSEI